MVIYFALVPHSGWQGVKKKKNQKKIIKFSVVLRPQRPYGLLGTGSPGRPPRLPHSSWALKQDIMVIRLIIIIRWTAVVSGVREITAWFCEEGSGTASSPQRQSIIQTFHSLRYHWTTEHCLECCLNGLLTWTPTTKISPRPKLQC